MFTGLRSQGLVKCARIPGKVGTNLGSELIGQYSVTTADDLLSKQQFNWRIINPTEIDPRGAYLFFS